MRTFQQIAAEVGELVAKKNAAYGDSFDKCGEFLRLLYPDGIKPAQYGEALAVVRVFDKLMRLATANDPDGESPWNDVCGYALLGIRKRESEAEDRKDVAELMEEAKLDAEAEARNERRRKASATKQPPRRIPTEELLDTQLGYADLPARALHVLSNYNVNTGRQLVQCTPSWLLSRKNFGHTSLDAVVDFLSEHGLCLATDGEKT